MSSSPPASPEEVPRGTSARPVHAGAGRATGRVLDPWVYASTDRDADFALEGLPERGRGLEVSEPGLELATARAEGRVRVERSTAFPAGGWS